MGYYFLYTCSFCFIWKRESASDLKQSLIWFSNKYVPVYEGVKATHWKENKLRKQVLFSLQTQNHSSVYFFNVPFAGERKRKNTLLPSYQEWIVLLNFQVTVLCIVYHLQWKPYQIWRYWFTWRPWLNHIPAIPNLWFIGSMSPGNSIEMIYCLYK